MSGKLFFSVGLPRSGKSTYAKRWASEAPMRAIVSSDSIRLALHGKRYEILAETMVFAIKHVIVRAMLAQGYSVLVDGTHTSEISIQRLLEIQIDAEPLIFLDTTRQVCIERAKATSQLNVIPAIERTNKNLLKLANGINWEKFPRDASLAIKENIAKIALRVLERQNNVV